MLLLLLGKIYKRVSQVATEVVGSEPDHRVSQVVVETLSPNFIVASIRRHNREAEWM